MRTLSGLVLLILAGTALADPAKIMEPCHITDFECLKKETTDFFTKTSEGLPELGTASIDPLEIPAFDVVFDQDIGVTFKLRNLYVSGLRNQKLHTFSFDKQTRKTSFSYKADLVIGADIVVDYSKKSKTFWGYFTSQPTVIYTFKCDLLKKNVQGEEHYEFGSETVTYDLVTSPRLDWGNEIKEKLANDAAWKNLSEETMKKFNKQTIDKIVTKVFPYVISNIRAANKILPATAVLKE